MSTERHPVLDDRTVEGLLTGHSGRADPELQRVLGLVRSMGAEPAPRPTSELADLLTTGFTPEAVPLRHPALRRRWAVHAAAGLTAAAASLLLAGTAQALPAALQDGVAGVVRALTPFDFPDDSSTPPQEPAAGNGPTSGPAPTQAPSGPDGDAPSPAHGVGDGTATGSDAAGGEGTGARSTGSPVPPPGHGAVRPSAPEVARDEPGSAAPEAPAARPEVNRAPASDGSPTTVPARPIPLGDGAPAGTGRTGDGPATDAPAAPTSRGAQEAGR